MSPFFQSQMDFVYVFYGLAFITLAAVCLGRHGRNDVLPWKWLGLFGLSHGLTEWLELVALGMGDCPWFAMTRVILMGVSFALLVEFARESLLMLRGKTVSIWAYVPLLSVVALTAMHGATLGANVGCRYTMGLGGGLASAAVMWMACSRTDRKAAVHLRVCSISMAVYAVATGVVVPVWDVLPASAVNQDAFRQATGFPIQFVRGLLAVVVTLSFWLYSRSLVRTQIGRSASARWAAWLPVALVGVLAGGWFVTNRLGQAEDQDMRHSVLQRARTAAACIDARAVAALKCDKDDVSLEPYQAIGKLLAEVRCANPDTRFVYLTRRVDNIVHFLADSEPQDSNDHSAPGSEYPEASERFVAAFDTGESFVEGPLPDEFGVWVSGLAPVRDETGRPIACFGIDIAASNWAHDIAHARLMPLGITCLLCVLVLGLFAAGLRLKLSAEMVMHSRRQYRSLVEGSPDAVQLLDHHERCLAINGTGLETMGCRESDIIGLRFSELWLPADRAMVERAIERVLQGQKQTFEARFVVPRSGQQQVRFVTLTPVAEDNGLIEQFVGVSRDITARKRSEQTLKEQDCLLEAVAQATSSLLKIREPGDSVQMALHRVGLAANVDRAYVFENHVEPKTARAMMSQRFEWAAGGVSAEIDNPALQNLPYDQGFERWQTALSAGKPVRDVVADLPACERTMLEAQGIQSILVLPIIVDAEFWGFIGFDDCHSRRVWKEYELNILGALGSAIGSAITRHRAEVELDEARRRAESSADNAAIASRAKSEFLANMSHEIRTPLNGVVGMIELLSNTGLNAQQQRYVQTVRRSADTLLSLINDVLDFSKIEAGKLDLDPSVFDLRSAIEDVVQVVAPSAKNKGVEFISHFSAQAPRWVVGDSTRIRQVVMNLMSNAAKFTVQGHVLADVKPDEISEHQVVIHIRVEDTGIGIAADKIEHIFDKFTQADSSTTRRFGGTGLGLAISRRLVEIMGGRIWVESELGKGSTFHLTLPLLRAASPVAEAPAATLDQLDGLRVLVVDDNAINRSVLQETLQLWKMQTVLADGGRAAMAILKDARVRPFDLVILDANMPDMNGLELAKIILNERMPVRGPVMMLTSSGHGAEAAQCREMNLTAYLVKPVRQAELLEAILVAMGQRTGVECEAPAAATASRSLNILLAEDNPVNQDVATGLLEALGHKVTVAVNGLAAVSAARSTAYDLIFMDIQMPEMGGFEATAQIRAWEKSNRPRTPIIAVTANAMKEDCERCLAAGMDAYLSKPVSGERIAEAIAQVLNVAPPAPAPAAAPPVEAKAQPQSSETAVINYDTLLHRCMSKPEMVRRVLKRFAESTMETLAALERAAASGDIVTAARHAHSLKGAAANISAEPLRAVAAEAERLAKAGADAAVLSMMPKLKLELERCIRQVPVLTGYGNPT